MSAFHSQSHKTGRVHKRTALKLLRNQRVEVNLQVGDTRIVITATEAQRLLSHGNTYSWKVTNGFLREMWGPAPVWRENYRSCSAAVLAFHGIQDYRPGVTTAANLGKLDAVAI